MLILRYLHCKLALFFSEMGWGIGILMIYDTVRRATFQYNVSKNVLQTVENQAN